MSLRRAVAFLAVLAFAACGHSGKSHPGARPAATRPAGLDCHGQSPVWVLGRGESYVLPGDRRYGSSKRGRYECLSEVQNQGLHAASRSGHRHHHRRRANPFY